MRWLLRNPQFSSPGKARRCRSTLQGSACCFMRTLSVAKDDSRKAFAATWTRLSVPRVSSIELGGRADSATAGTEHVLVAEQLQLKQRLRVTDVRIIEY